MSVRLIDTHAHLTFDAFGGEVGPVLARAEQAGVGRVICVGTDPDDGRRVRELADRYDSVFAAYGIHPHEADRYDDPGGLREFLTTDKAVAVGETGLDYHYDFADRVRQGVLFERHLALAGELALPVIVHCRDAFDDTLAAIRSAGGDLTGVFHCFTGSDDEARRVVDLGWYVSFGGILTFKTSDALRGVARQVPADRLLVETDAPYLSPEPVRAHRPNEPAYVRYVAERLAQVRRVDTEKLLEGLWANTVRLFSQSITGDRV